MPHPHKILLVEDNPEVCRVVRSALREFQLETVGTIGEARQQFRESAFDLLILDVNLPDEDGFEFCEELGQGSLALPAVFFLTGRTDISEKLRGFSLGADDYITKPFNPIELRARIEACLRRRSVYRESQEVTLIGNLKFFLPLQRAEAEIRGKWKDLGLSSIEFKILFFLAQNESRVITREMIIDRIWGTGSEVLDRTIDSHVSRLRKSLEGSSRTIRAVYGAGYRFVASDPAQRLA